MRLGCIQPSYLPWCGYLDQMAQSDVFILLDSVQYDKDGWRNRNRVKTAQGVQWLTVPVLTKRLGPQLIKDVRIDNHTDWKTSHVKSIEQNYRKSPYFEIYFWRLKDVYQQQWDKLADLDCVLTMLLKDMLGIHTKIRLSSNVCVSSTDNVQRLIEYCKEFGADEFIEGDAGKDYLDGEGEERFKEAGIKLIYHSYQHPVYPQLYGPFQPYLSILDLLFNCGPDSLDILTHRKEIIS